MIVDLRSDTVTRPTTAMRAAMVEAEVGDDVYGEDPTVNRLEAEVAELLGHEAGLFVPSGSMGNQLGLRLHARPGEEIVCDVMAHIARAELGHAAAFSGITFRTWASRQGLLDVESVRALIAPDAGPYLVSTTAVGLPLPTEIAEGPLRIAGRSYLTGKVTTYTPDARAFLALAVGTSPMDAQIVQNNMLPLRVPTAVSGRSALSAYGTVRRTTTWATA